MTRTDKLATSLLIPINPAIIVILGGYTLLWGLWIINPFWNVLGTAPLYWAMARIFPEWVWGGIAVASGLIIIRGAVKPSYKNLLCGACTGALHWFVIAILYFMGDWMNTGGITSLTFAIYCAVVWVNLKVNKETFK